MIKFHQTHNDTELENLIKEIKDFYNSKIDEIDIRNTTFDDFIEKSEYYNTLIKADLERAVNLYNPKVSTNIDILAARLLQYHKMISPYLEFSKRISQIINEWGESKENQY